MNGSGFDHQDKTRNGSAAISFCQQPSRSQPYMIGCNYLTGDDATFIAHRTPRVSRPILAFPSTILNMSQNRLNSLQRSCRGRDVFVILNWRHRVEESRDCSIKLHTLARIF